VRLNAVSFCCREGGLWRGASLGRHASDDWREIPHREIGGKRVRKDEPRRLPAFVNPAVKPDSIYLKMEAGAGIYCDKLCLFFGFHLSRSVQKPDPIEIASLRNIQWKAVLIPA